MTKKNNDITLADINKLAVPAILAGISEPLISIADSAIIGRLGIQELGAVGISTSFFFIISLGIEFYEKCNFICDCS